MRTIEISTTQNVIIQHGLANLLDRVLAFGIDVILLFIFVVIGQSILELNGEFSSGAYLFLIIPLSFYSLITHSIFRGQTLGKLLIGIKVIRLDGAQPNIIEYFQRWSLRFLDVFLSMGFVATISIFTSDRNQTFGDKVAGTMVIKLRGDQRKYKLSDILQISKSENYAPIYPEITAFSEPQMLLLKKLVVRSEKYKNKIYPTLLSKVCHKIERDLGLNRKERSDLAFARQLIKDYVILTR